MRRWRARGLRSTRGARRGSPGRSGAEPGGAPRPQAARGAVAAAPAFAQAQYGQIERGVSEEPGATAVAPVSDDGFIAFRAAGDQATGDYRCSRCGYGVSV